MAAGTQNQVPPRHHQGRRQPREPFVLPGNRTLKKPAWLNQVVRYHNRGNIEFSSCSVTS